jgi:hypothetical protein
MTVLGSVGFFPRIFRAGKPDYRIGNGPGYVQVLNSLAAVDAFSQSGR